MILDEGGTYAETFLMGAGGDEADGRHTVVHQLLGQLSAGHAGIADGEVEAVGNGTVEVTVVDDMEVMAQEDFLQLMGALAIDLDVVAEAVLSVAGSSHHGSPGILCRMAGAAA